MRVLEAKVGSLLAQLKTQSKDFEAFKASVQTSSSETQKLRDEVQELELQKI